MLVTGLKIAGAAAVLLDLLIVLSAMKVSWDADEQAERYRREVEHRET